MQTIVMSSLSDESNQNMSSFDRFDVENPTNEANELLALDYLREQLLPNPPVFNNFISLALHSTSGMFFYMYVVCKPCLVKLYLLNCIMSICNLSYILSLFIYIVHPEVTSLVTLAVSYFYEKHVV